LRWSLTGTAAQLLWGSEQLPYEQLLDKLTRRFSGKGMEEKFQTELRCRRRNKGESLRELAYDIRRLMTLAYPGKHSNLSEHIARDAFLSALGDPDFELKIREREPADLDDTLRIAQRYEVFKGAVESSSASRSRWNRSVIEGQEVKATEDVCNTARCHDSAVDTQSCGQHKRSSKMESDSETRWKTDIVQRLNDLEVSKREAEQRAENFCAVNTALNKEVDRLKYLQQLRAASNGGVQGQMQQLYGTSGSQRPHHPSRVLGPCFKCSQMGHLQRNCPVRDKLTQQSANMGSVHTKGVSRRKRQFVNATYLRARIGQQLCDCFLDTGSEVTVIPASMVRKEDIKDTVQSLSAANGTEIAVLGEVSLSFSVGEFNGVLSGLVSEHVGEVMLGIDWMTNNAVTWEFDRSRIKIRQRYYNLRRHANDRTWCRRVVLQDDVIIPSRSEIDLSATVIVRKLSDNVRNTGLDWETEALLLVPGVHVSRTVIPGDRLSSIPVRVMNVRSEDVKLKAGTNVADLSPVSVIGSLTVGADVKPCVAGTKSVHEKEKI